MTNEDLAAQAQKGSERAFGELYDRLGPRLYNFLLRRVRDGDAAEDLTQEAFLRAWRSIGRYDRRWRFSTWLFTIGSRLASNHQRTIGRTVNGLETARPTSPEDGPDSMLIQREDRRQLWIVAERALPSDQLSSLWLRYAEDLPIAEVARIMEKSNVAVRVLLFRARRALADALAETNDGDARIRSSDGANRSGVTADGAGARRVAPDAPPYAARPERLAENRR